MKKTEHMKMRSSVSYLKLNIKSFFILSLLSFITLPALGTHTIVHAIAISSGYITNVAGAEKPFSLFLASYDGEDGFAITRPDQYEYAPSVIKVDGSTARMWFCGGGGTGSLGGDSIWYSQNTNYGRWGSWSAPVEVIRPSNNYSYLDYAHACDPSVIVHDSFYYVMYTGAPDWRNSGRGSNEQVSLQCPANNPTGCDNRIFAARVPVSSPENKQNYQKLVNVGECVSSSCFQWQTFWPNNATEYPPVPIIRNEIGSVWRRYGTGQSGYTTPQTNQYGIGQPSQVNIGALRVWFTNINSSNASEDLWTTDYQNIGSSYNLQANSSYLKKKSNVGNDVNYDVAYDSGSSRYVATIARQRADSFGRPCVHASQFTGYDTTNFTAPIISNNLWDQTTCFLAANSNAHNTGFMRDSYGSIAEMAGHSGGPLYNWVFYGTDIDKINTDGGKVNINRVPFSID